MWACFHFFQLAGVMGAYACEFMRLGWAPPVGVCIQHSALDHSPSSSRQKGSRPSTMKPATEPSISDVWRTKHWLHWTTSWHDQKQKRKRDGTWAHRETQVMDIELCIHTVKDNETQQLLKINNVIDPTSCWHYSQEDDTLFLKVYHTYYDDEYQHYYAFEGDPKH